MHRVMVFIDYQNFNINLKEHYKGKTFKPINYWALGKAINEIIPFQSEVLKTYLFAYKPCDDLMKIESYSKYYEWLTKLKKTPYLEIIEGRQELRTYDYIKVVETLHNIGKIVVIAHFKHQNVSRYDDICDSNIILYDNVLNQAVNKKYNETKEQD